MHMDAGTRVKIQCSVLLNKGKFAGHKEELKLRISTVDANRNRQRQNPKSKTLKRWKC